MARLSLLAALSAVVLGLTGPPPRAAAQVTDRALIAFERDVDKRPSEIYVMATDGSGARRLAAGCCIDWSPDGKRLAYVGSDGLYVIAADGSGQQRLTDSAARALDWSPDGERIVFSGYKPRGIFIVRVDGTGAGRLTTASDDYPRWSPNGQRIAFQRFLLEPNNNGEDVFVMNADGSQVQRLTRGSGHEHPSWSPDSRRIAYQSWSDETAGDFTDGYLANLEISVMDANGRNPRPLTHSPRSHDWAPVWSPRGGRILFLNQTDRRRYAVHVVNPDGRRHRNLTARSWANADPGWSPDGRSIVFASARDGTWDIFVMTAAGKNPTNLTKSSKGSKNTSPMWSP